MKSVKVLLADDNQRFLESTERFLRSIPDINMVAVGKALSGEEAIRLSSELKPDLILMDLAMPGMSGLEATRLIKQAGEAPRVVILTIHENDEYRRAAEGAGADGFVTKSDFAEKLVPMVRSLFPQSSCEPSSGHCEPHHPQPSSTKHSIERLAS
jgi:two-component system invasion response regulator UvrY